MADEHISYRAMVNYEVGPMAYTMQGNEFGLRNDSTAPVVSGIGAGLARLARRLADAFAAQRQREVDREIARLHRAAKAAGLDALFEVHAEAEIGRARVHGAEIIGVNNRDLAVFTTDLALSERLIARFPEGMTAVSESGINTAVDAARARRAGAHAVLVGEALMRSPDPAALIASFRTA